MLIKGVVKMLQRSKDDRLFDITVYTLFTLILLLVLYPLYFVVIASVSDPAKVLSGGITFWPRGFQLDGYMRIFEHKRIWNGYGNSVKYTVLGTFLNILLTLMLAYPLSRSDFKMRKPLMVILMITMYFSGGLIPTYLVVDGLGLTGKWPVMIILGAVSVYNVIISRTFISTSIPSELQDSAHIDGCDDIRYLFRIVIPLSKALIAVLCLYYGLNHWNGYFNAMIYLRDKSDYPLQLVLREILSMSKIDQEMVVDVPGIEKQREIAESIKYGLIIVASLPMLVLYPFLQKYFVKGIMLGSVKG